MINPRMALRIGSAVISGDSAAGEREGYQHALFCYRLSYSENSLADPKTHVDI